MPKQKQLAASVLDINFQAEIIALVLVFIVTTMTIPAAQAQTFTVLHTFTGTADGANPLDAGLAMDGAGSLYGATALGGPQTEACSYFGSCGTVFKLSPRGSSWTFDTLYGFTGGSDGNYPDAPIAFGPDGVIYSTTFFGGSNNCNYHGCGVVYSLRPPAAFCRSALCPWSETVLYRFTGESDGGEPAGGALAFDQTGNLYGTAATGGAHAHGDVYELVHNSGQWTLNVLYSFTGQSDGGASWSGVTFASAGNMYGTTADGGLYQGGTAFELSPSGTGWNLTPIHQFVLDADGYLGVGNLLLDSSGNLRGTNEHFGMGGGGTAYELTFSNGSWHFSVLHSFSGGYGPQGAMVMDQAGNLYGTTVGGGAYGPGTVFKLTPSDGGWNYTVLHNFTGGSDGANPYGQIVLDGNDNLYGTTSEGGTGCNGGCGVVWKIAP